MQHKPLYLENSQGKEVTVNITLGTQDFSWLKGSNALPRIHHKIASKCDRIFVKKKNEHHHGNTVIHFKHFNYFPKLMSLKFPYHTFYIN